jgi:hypothetical protein
MLSFKDGKIRFKPDKADIFFFGFITGIFTWLGIVLVAILFLSPS